MAAFSVLYAEVGDYLHDLGSNMDTRIKEWINFAQQDVATEALWPFLLREDAIVTTADDDTGTAAVTVTDATVDFSTESIPATMEYGQYYFKPDDTAICYPVDSRTDADTFELAAAYAGTTDGTAEYILRRVLYSLPSDVGTILTVRSHSSPKRMAKMDPGTLDVIDPANSTVGEPYRYMEFGVDGSGYRQLLFHPVPTSAKVIHIRYYKVLSDLSGDSDVSDIPVDFHEALIWGACWRGHLFLDDPQSAAAARAQYDDIIRTMRRRYLTSPDDIFRKGTIDSGMFVFFGPRFPTTAVTE